MIGTHSREDVMKNPWRWMALPLLVACFGVSGCGSTQPIDQAIQCNQFTRLSDGSWSPTTEVSIDYAQNGTRYQANYAKGVVLKTYNGGQDALIVAALQKKCAPSQ
jgi:hypothetical protein